MGLLGIPTWTLFVCLSWLCVGQGMAKPHYMVTVPAVIEAGAETKFCASLLWPNETIIMSVSLSACKTKSRSKVIFQKMSKVGFHDCHSFQAPMVEKPLVCDLVVEIRGAVFRAKQVRKIMFKRYKPFTFVQTDRPIYRPGQEVQFRIATLDTKLRPVTQPYSLIEIENPNSNRIGQWQNLTSSTKILQLSYYLNSEAREGTYNIIVTIEEQKTYHTFKVDKYVLPKFEVKINASDEVSVTQEKIKAEICAAYTYGQPVPGNIEAELCRILERNVIIPLNISPGRTPEITPPCHKETKKTNTHGCATFYFDMSIYTKVHKYLQDMLLLTAEVEEEGTGISQMQEKRISLSYQEGSLEFIDIKNYYEKGAVVHGKIKAVYYNQAPAANKRVYLFEGERWSANLHSNLTTDSHGIARFHFSTYNFTGDIRLHANTKPSLEYPGYRVPHFEIASHKLSLVQSSSPDEQTISYLQIKKIEKPIAADAEVEISIHYTFVGEGAYHGSADVIYLVLAKGKIVKQGYQNVKIFVYPVTEGEVTFRLKVTAEFAPEFQVVAYVVLPSENVIAHKVDFPTEKFFAHKVSVDFWPSTATPGEQVRLLMKALPYSLCGLTSVDHSVYIKEPGKPLDADMIFDLLPVKKATYIPYEVEDQQDCVHVRPKRSILPYPGYSDKDTYMILQSVGLKMATDLVIRTPECLKYKGREYYNGVNRYIFKKQLFETFKGPGELAMAGTGPEPAPIVTIRQYFPETWLFQLVEVGQYGKKEMHYTVPDTITTWFTDTFCLSDQGFGLAPRHELLVFQPFFLDLTMPYSIIRGEHLELKATVFNFLSSCIMSLTQTLLDDLDWNKRIHKYQSKAKTDGDFGLKEYKCTLMNSEVTVTPGSSTEYTLTPHFGDKYTFCLCGRERKTVRWSLAANVLGVLNITVSAEAVSSHIKCGNEVVTVPERGRIDVITRPLIVEPEGIQIIKTYSWLLIPKGGVVTEELEIQLPRNMIAGSGITIISVVGDILGRVLRNLDKLLRMPYGCGEQNMLTLAPDVSILEYLTATNQLTPAIKEKAIKFLISGYQRQLNFKHLDGAFSAFGRGQGNTWLTAFVLKTFVRAQAFVFIDPDIIRQSRIWLEGKQQENGCFEMVGKLFHNRMKGGVNDEVTLTAYITAGLLQMGVPVTHSVVKKSLSCLKKSINNFENTYTVALLAYVYTLAEDQKIREHLLDHLESVAVSQGNYLHWSQGSKDTSISLSVETTAYVLLARIGKSPDAEDLGYASRIVRWLTSQQNSFGGFSSTQDTVVALEALSLYGSLVYSASGASTVATNYPSGRLTFEVNQHNSLLYQERVVKIASGKYTVEVKGRRTVSIQIVVKYNIPTPKLDSNYEVDVKAEADCSHSPHQVTLDFTSLYKGRDPISNMAILDIKMLSGFFPHGPSLKKLRQAPLVERVDYKGDHVIVYMDELKKNKPVHHSLLITQAVPVEHLKPAVVTFYDYYEPKDHDSAEYTYPCRQD